MLLLVDIRYVAGGVDTYAIPITAAFGQAAERISRECEPAIIGELQIVGSDGQKMGVLYDALWSEDAAYVILQRHRFGGEILWNLWNGRRVQSRGL